YDRADGRAGDHADDEAEQADQAADDGADGRAERGALQLVEEPLLGADVLHRDDLGLRGEGQLRAGLVHGGGDLHGGAVGGLLRGQRDAGDLLARRVGQGDRLAVRVEAPGATGDGGDDGAARVGDD